MIDMFDRIPGPKHWAVWIVLIAQFASATISIGSLATAAGVFVSSLIPITPTLAGWLVTFVAVGIVWSGVFDVLKMVMSVFVFVIVVGVIYVAAHVFPGAEALLENLRLTIPQVPAWAQSIEGVKTNPWQEILPLIGWGAGGFASQVWYSYWVIGAGYGATAGRGYGKPADLQQLKEMTRQTAERVKGWCHVLYADGTVGMVIGIVVTSAFLIAGAGVLRPMEIAPEGSEVAIELSNVFSTRWGALGGFLFLLAGATALMSTQVGQLAGWPRLLADCFRICIPGFNNRFAWKTQYRMFLIFFLCANMIIVFCFTEKPVFLVQLSALLDGLLLTPLQAILIAVGLFVVMPKMLSREAFEVLKPSWIFAVGLIIAFLVFGYFCVFQIPDVLFPSE
jgi:hypothetical protein